jgi:hypothetical protein
MPAALPSCAASPAGTASAIRTSVVAVRKSNAGKRSLAPADTELRVLPSGGPGLVNRLLA